MMIDSNVPPRPDETSGKNKKLMETIDRLYRRGAKGPLAKVLGKLHPVDMASVLRTLPEDHVAPIFSAIPDISSASESFNEVSSRVRNIILNEIACDELAPILETLPPDELSDLIQELDPEIAEQLMAAMQRESISELENLLQYAPESAGGIMTTDFFTLNENVTVDQAIKAIRGEEDVETIYYLYVTDPEGRLVGVISLREMLLADPDIPLRQLMNSRIVRVSTEDDQSVVADLVDKYHLLAVPVVDDENVLVGMVTVDDVLEVMETEATRDILKMAGTSESEILTQSPLKIARIRLPWLLAAFGGGLAATGIIQQYESILGQVLALSAFLPVVMGMAGNVGVQSATVAVRGLATGTLLLRHVRTVWFKELRVGLLLGAFYGITLGIFGYFMFDSEVLDGVVLGQVVGLSILINMTMASSLAILLPMFFHRIGTDPAIATGPFVTTAIDVFGVLNYFIIATYLLDLT